MRYELDENGYICKVFFGCHSGNCTLYEGEIPVGYETLEDWATQANIRAYKLVDGNLTYDIDRAVELQIQWENLEKGLLWSGVCSVGETVTLLENIKNYKSVYIKTGTSYNYAICPIIPNVSAVRGLATYTGNSNIEIVSVRATCDTTNFKLESIQQFKIATSGISNVDISAITEIWGIV
jgi:hypothetical protein